MHSALYIGRVRHRRFAPRTHAFAYRLAMLYLDLDELDQVFRGRWLWSTRRPALAWWRRADYLGDPQAPLVAAVRACVAREIGRAPAGPIRMLTHPRYFGYVFNPVTFYYCFDAPGERVETIVAEVANTPWNERHTYVLPVVQDAAMASMMRFQLAKRFHVSPFIAMNIDYDWRFGTPGRTLAVHMNDFEAGAKIFDATLMLERVPITGRSLAAALVGFPAMTVQVIAGIYWQALRLALKRVPFHAHPRTMRVDRDAER